MYYPISALLIECLILSIVNVKDSYGYEISRSIKRVSNINESTLYPILKKLVKNGFLTTYSELHNGRRRKYYKITDSGRVQLDFLKKNWLSYRDEIDNIVIGGEDNE